MTRIIACASGKGGAGKTTIVSNLGAVLAELGRDVAVVDANLTTPNLGIHLGVPLFPTTLHDVLKGKARIHDAIYRHESGLKIIPAGIAMKDLRGVDARDLPNAMLDLLGNVDIVLIDVSAGLGRESLAAFEAADELLLITNPDLPSVTDALKTAKLAEQIGTKVIGVVVNKVSGRKHEMSRREIMGMLDNIDMLAEIPDDVNVPKSISRRTPVVHYQPNSMASREMRRLAARLIGERSLPSLDKEPWYKRMLPFLFSD